MEGHITSIILKDGYRKEEEALFPLSNFEFPMIALLISGGHTQIVLVKDWGDYEILGETIDDAVGEAFDKVARMLGMKYPGGPKISQQAQKGQENEKVKFPRPMLHSGDYRFSFSGLKTSVRYFIRDLEKDDKLDEQMIADISREFEHAVTEVLVKKTIKAIKEYNAKGLIIAGGVSANKFIREEFKKESDELGVHLYTPEKMMCGDNSLMIATAGFIKLYKNKKATLPAGAEIVAIGNLRI
jgi:N6-L-threonylcarbamoyladenine synthase